MDDPQYYGLRLPLDVYDELRRAAFETKRTMSSIVIEAIEDWLKKAARNRRRRKS